MSAFFVNNKPEDQALDSWGVSSETIQRLNGALTAAWAELASRASEAGFQELLMQVFGASAEAAAELASRVSAGDTLGLSFELVSGSELGSAAGAYAAVGPNGVPTVYLNADWAAGATDEQIRLVLLEEIGQSFDTQLNGSSDTPGDEGELLAKLFSGIELSAEERAAIEAEDDSATLTIEGVEVAVEQRVTATGISSTTLGATNNTQTINRATAQAINVTITYNGADNNGADILIAAYNNTTLIGWTVYNRSTNLDAGTTTSTTATLTLTFNLAQFNPSFSSSGLNLRAWQGTAGGTTNVGTANNGSPATTNGTSAAAVPFAANTTTANANDVAIPSANGASVTWTNTSVDAVAPTLTAGAQSDQLVEAGSAGAGTDSASRTLTLSGGNYSTDYLTANGWTAGNTPTPVTTANDNGSGYSYEIKSGQVAAQSFTITGSGTYAPSALQLAIARETADAAASSLPIKVEIATAASGGTVLFAWSGTGATFPQNASKDAIDTRTSVTLTQLNNATLTFGTEYFIRVSSTDSFGKVYWSGSSSNLTGLPAGNTFENGSSQTSKDFEYQLTYASVPTSYTKTGTYGAATLNTSTGVVSYTLNNNDADTNALAASASASDSFTVRAVDTAGNATDTPISFAITGSNDENVNDTPVLAAVTSGSLTDTAVNDSFSNITGTLAGTDSDSGQTLTYGITGGTVSAGTSTIAGTYGTLSLNTSTGAYTYTPNTTAINALSANATDSFTFTLADGAGGSTTTGYTVNITGVNDTPVLAAVTSGSLTDTAANDSFSNITGTLAGSDRDTGSTLTYGITGGTVSSGTSTIAGTYGSLSVITATGAYTYTPNATAINALSANASDSFTFTLSDGSLSTTTGFTVNITGVNDTPVLAAVTSGSLTDTAANDSFFNITGTLVGSDRDTGSTLTYGITGGTVSAGTSTRTGTYGSLSVNTSTGAYTYTPNASAINALSANATDTFTFSVSDGSLSTTSGFTVNITGVNDTPTLAAVTSGSLTDTAANDSFNAITGTLVGSDRDTGSTLTYGITGGTVSAGTSTRTGTYGSLSVNTSTGAYTYTPNASAINALSANATDTFTFSVSDGSLSTTSGFTVNITGTNDVATLTSDTEALSESDAVLSTGGTLILSDLDATDATVVAQTDAAGTYGKFSINAAGVWTYATNSALNELNANQVVTETFNVATTDGGSASVTVNITGTNDVATLTSDTEALSESDAVLTTGGTLILSDLDATDATVVAQTDAAGTYGKFSIDAAGAWSYATNDAVNQLNAGQVVTEIFTVATTDGGSASVTVNITGTNDAAVLSSASVALAETNAPLTTGGTLTISDVDSPETFVAQTNTSGTNGSFSITSAGVWSYTANSTFDSLNVGQSVTDTFSVAAADGTNTSVTVTINGTNDAPTVAAQLADQSATEDSAFSFTVPAGAFADVDTGTTLAYSATLANGNVLPNWLSFDAATRTFSGTPLNGDVGSISVTVTASDGSLSASDTFAITVANTNDAPTGSLTISGTPSEGQTLSAVSSLADDDGLGTLAFQWNADGVAIAGATGTTYTLTQAEVGKTITVTASYTDGRGTAESVTSAPTAAVANVDTVAPVFSSATTAAVNENVAAGTVVYSAAASDSDFNAPDTANSITYSLSGTNAGAFTIDSVTGVVKIKASPDFETTPSYAFSVVATDAAGNFNSQAVALTITDLDEIAPDAPVLALGSGVTGGATAAEATQSSGVVTVTAEAGASVAVSFSRGGGSVTKTVTGAGTTPVAVVLDAADLTTLGDGSISVSAIATDAAGNSSAAGTTSFTLDTAVAAPLVALSSDSGDSAADKLTNNAALSITGTEAGASVEYSANGTNGWSSSATSPSQGSNTAYVRQTDLAGNVSAATAFSFSFDNVAPTPVISAIGGTDSTVSGQAGDNRVVGTAEANRSVSIFSGATLLGSTTADANGAFSYALTAANITTIGQGSAKSITASQSDAAGNTGSSAAFNFAVDTIAPTLAITTPIAGDGFLNNVEDESSLTISGTAAGADGRTVTVTVSDTKTTTTSYSLTPTVSSGTWSVTLSSEQLKAFAQGRINVSAAVSDAAGNPATAATASFLYDITPLVAPVIAATNISGTRATLVITADPGARLNIYSSVNGGPTTLLSGGANNLVSSNGRYSFTTPELADGAYSFTTTSLDQAGNESPASVVREIAILPPALPTVTFTDTGISANDGITSNGVFTVGNITAGNSWQYSTNGGASWITGSSTNSFTLLPSTYASGALRVRQLDTAGKVGTAFSNTSAITVDVGAPTVAVSGPLNKTSLGLVGDAAETVVLTFTFSEDPGATFTAEDITVSAGTISAISGSGLTRTATYTPPIDFVGSATLTVASGRFTDLAGNINVDGGDTAPETTNTVSFSLNTLRASSAPQVSISSSNNRLKIGDTSTLTFNFTQPPSDFTGTDITVSSGSISGLAKSTTDSKVWTALYTPAADVQGAVTITVAVGSFGVDGNAGAGTNASPSSLSLNVDTVAPASVQSVAFSADTGSSGNDLITNDPNQTVTGTVSGTLSSAVGFTDTVRVSIDNGTTWRLAAVTGETRTGFSLGNVTLRGPSTILVVVEDEAGNTSSTFSRPYTYDPITFTGELVLSDYSGNPDSTIRQASGSDNSFTLTLPNKEPGASEVFQVSTDSGTTWTTTTAAQSGLLDGTYRYRGIVTDTAGNTATSNVWTVVVDRTAPGVPTLSLASGATGTNDPVTNQELTSGAGVLRVSAEAGATLQLSFSSSATDSTAFTKSVVAGGSTQAVVLTIAEVAQLRGTAPANGSYTATVNAWAVDRAGNVGASLPTPLTFAYSPDPVVILGELRVEVPDNGDGSEAGPTDSIFRISRTGSTAAAVTVTYRLAGSAIAGVDYTTPDGFDISTGIGTVTIAAGSTSVDVNIPTIDNANQDGLRQIRLNLQTTPSYTLNPLGSFDIATLTDNDAPLIPELSVADLSVVEGNTGTKTVNFTLRLSQATTRDVSFNYAFRAGTATMGSSTGSDFNSVGAAAGTYTIAAGVSQINLSAVVAGDTTVETDENFFLDLSAANGLTFRGGGSTLTATANIVNDDSATQTDPNQGLTITSSGDFSGTSLNDVLTGDDGVNRIDGLAGNDRITGGLSADLLFSGLGADQFIYRSFAESSQAFGVDTTDASFTSGDRIGLPSRPTALYNVGVINSINVTSLPEAFAAAQADKDVLGTGAQALLPGEAVMFTWGTSSRNRRTYLAVADADAGSTSNDFLLNTPQSSFAIGSLDVQAFFL